MLPFSSTLPHLAKAITLWHNGKECFSFFGRALRYGITDIVRGSWRHLWVYCPFARSICCMKLAARRVCCVSFAVRRVRLRQGLNYWLGFNKFNCTPHRTAAVWPPVGEQWAAQRAIKWGLATSLGLGIGIAIEAGDGGQGGIALWPGQKKENSATNCICCYCCWACQQFCLSVRSLNTFARRSHLFAGQANKSTIPQTDRQWRKRERERGSEVDRTDRGGIIILISAKGSTWIKLAARRHKLWRANCPRCAMKQRNI